MFDKILVFQTTGAKKVLLLGLSLVTLPWLRTRRSEKTSKVARRPIPKLIFFVSSQLIEGPK